MSLRIGIGLKISSSSFAPNGVPSGLVLTILSSTSIRLDWIGGSTNNDGTSIERSTDGILYTEIATVAAGIVTYTNNGLILNKYYYRLREYLGSNYSVYCTAVSNLEPLILYDGNTVGWWDYLDTPTITLVGSEVVTWADRLGSGNDLPGGGLGNDPLLTANGIRCYSATTRYFLPKAFVWNQPCMIYLAARQTAWTSGHYLLTSFAGPAAPWLRQSNGGASPNITVQAGLGSLNTNDWILNTFAILRMLFNGVGGTLQVNELAKQTNNLGANNMGGLTLGAWVGVTATDIETKELIGRTVADSDANQLDIYNYIKIHQALII
jgi:hypothetical protein